MVKEISQKTNAQGRNQGDMHGYLIHLRNQSDQWKLISKVMDNMIYSTVQFESFTKRKNFNVGGSGVKLQ